ncbi:MAG: hypothetical protein RIB53_16570 [Roseitalea porphyridii]|jgi:hypothetical protein|uniref:hypothetical protein n=1 Tax=Roseitalea porphyridii TaxID=1852022 RepID=UPI0032EB830C
MIGQTVEREAITDHADVDTPRGEGRLRAQSERPDGARSARGKMAVLTGTAAAPSVPATE